MAHGERQQRIWPRLEGRYCANVLRKTDSNADRYSNCNSYRDSYVYSNTNGDVYSDADGDSDSYTYFDTETFTDAEICADAEAASYRAAAPVSVNLD
jgi:hypothetical protein